MTESNNFFELTEWFKKNVDWLNLVLIGGEADSALIDGVEKPSIDKRFADRFAEIQALVDSALVFETKALMDAYTPTPNSEGFYPLAKVWKDTEENSGVYGYSGGVWIKSSYTTDIADTVDSTVTSRAVSGSAVASHVKSAQTIAGILDNVGYAVNRFGVNAIDTNNFLPDRSLVSEVVSPYLKSIGISSTQKGAPKDYRFVDGLGEDWSNKWLTVGFVAPSDENDPALQYRISVGHQINAGGVWQPKTAKSGTDVNEQPIGGGFSFYFASFELSETYVNLNEIRVQCGKTYSQSWSSDPNGESCSPFLAVTDSEPFYQDLVVFPQASKPELARINQLVLGAKLWDEIQSEGTEKFIEWSGNDAAVVTDVPELLRYQANGACWEYIPNGTNYGNKYYIADFGGNRAGHYYYFTYYTWGENEPVYNMDLFYAKNGSYQDARASNLGYRKTHLGNNVVKIEIRGKFPDTVTDTDVVGLMVGASYGIVTQRVLVFGAIGATSLNKYELGCLSPVVNIPEFEPVNRKQLSEALSRSVPSTTHWHGKKICWIGHSIPATSGHPEIVGSLLGAEIKNKCIGGTRPYLSSTKLYDTYSLGRSICLDAEKMAEWYDSDIGLEIVSTSDFTLSPGSGVTLTQAMVDAAYGASYEFSMIGPDTIDADLYVIEYGWNSAGVANEGHDVTPTDNTTFGGAYRFLIEKVTAAKQARGEKANFLIVTHSNNVSAAIKLKNDYQRTMGEYFSINVASPDKVLGIWNSDILTDWIPDGVHPELNSKVSYQIARVVADEILKMQPTDDIS